MAKKAAKKAVPKITAEKVAANFVLGYTPSSKKKDLPKDDFKKWLAVMLALRMDETIWYGQGSVPAELRPGKAKLAALELMSHVKNLAEKDPLSGISDHVVLDALTDAIAEPGTTTAELAELLKEKYNFG